MPTTKKNLGRRFVGIALVLGMFGWIFWQYGFEATNRIRFGLCQSESATGVEIISREVALERFANSIKTNKPLKKQSLSCSYWPITNQGGLALNDVGLTKQAQTVVDEAEKVFGYIPKGGYEPGGVSTGHIKGSAHYEGRAIDFFYRPHEKPQNRRAGWQLAIWATLYAEELNIETVIFDDHIWTRLNSTAGWRPYVHPSGDRENPILRHLDHVHIDVN